MHRLQAIVFILAIALALALTRFLSSVGDLSGQAERNIAEANKTIDAQTKLQLEAMYGHECMTGVTMRGYELLQPGHSEIDARNIIGKEGVEQSSIGGMTTKAWHGNEKGKAIVLSFQNGRMVGKSQVGLTE